jgi:hypothetical protein
MRRDLFCRCAAITRTDNEAFCLRRLFFGFTVHNVYISAFKCLYFGGLPFVTGKQLLLMKHKILKNSITVLCVLAVALLFYALNRLTPLYADDYAYTRDFMTKEQVDSVADICASMRLHYIRVNGRIVVHFLAHLFLWWGKPVFNVINTAAMLALGTLMYMLAAGTLKDFKITSWLLGLLVSGCSRGLRAELSQADGACNYLFGADHTALSSYIQAGRRFQTSAPVICFVSALSPGGTPGRMDKRKHGRGACRRRAVLYYQEQNRNREVPCLDVYGPERLCHGLFVHAPRTRSDSQTELVSRPDAGFIA